MKKALIFDQYLDSLGGGERYCLDLAKVLAANDWEINLAWKDTSIYQAIKTKFDLDPAKWLVDNKAYSLFSQQGQLWSKYLHLRQYDFIFYLSDGSIPFLFGKKNWLHFQVPFTKLKPKPIDRLKLLTINKVVCNSFFTKKVIDQTFALHSEVLYPPVDMPCQPKKKDKKNIILSVGRFDEVLNAKRQDVLIDSFKKMVDKGLKGWQLVLAGGVRPQSKQVSALRKSAVGYPIKIASNVSYVQLKDYFSKSKIYWHAAGFGIDEDREPEHVEHFGITIVEAMACANAVLAVGKGGVKEIIDDKKDGLLWSSKEELITKTKKLVKDSKQIKQLSQAAIKKATRFSSRRFAQEILRLISHY